jgi:hypothetical protein
MLREKSGIRLDIGCGAGKQGPDWVGMDKQALPGVDIVHDWNVYPWPLPDECVLVAIASHVVEHVNPADGGFLRWMDEVWRVLRYDGEFAIATPHGASSGYLQDPTHCNPCNEATWAYFDPLEPNSGGALYKFYRPRPWRIKFLSWNPAANIEVVLVKRRLDRSYDA